MASALYDRPISLANPVIITETIYRVKGSLAVGGSEGDGLRICPKDPYLLMNIEIEVTFPIPERRLSKGEKWEVGLNALKSYFL